MHPLRRAIWIPFIGAVVLALEQQANNSKHSSGNKKAEEEANRDAEKKLGEIKSAGSKSGDQVVSTLLKLVTEVKPEVPDRVQASDI
jgi:Vacuolar (H+)-ATPase G subunit